jgi:hypothetical protein
LLVLRLLVLLHRHGLLGGVLRGDVLNNAPEGRALHVAQDAALEQVHQLIAVPMGLLELKTTSTSSGVLRGGETPESASAMASEGPELAPSWAASLMPPSAPSVAGPSPGPASEDDVSGPATSAADPSSSGHVALEGLHATKNHKTQPR